MVALDEKHDEKESKTVDDDDFEFQTEMEKDIMEGGGDDGADGSVEIGQDESKAVNRVRVILMLVLLLVAAAVSTAVYMFSRAQEVDDFQKQFTVQASKVIDSIVSTTARSLRAIEGFALQITIHAIDHHQTWPGVAISDFESRAKITLDLAEAISLLFIPIVTNETRHDWESFSVVNQGWLGHGLSIQDPIEDKDEQENLDQLIETYGHDPLLRVPERIFKVDENGPKVETGRDFYAPWWQFAPAFPTSTIINYNTLSNPSYYDEIMSLMETERTIVGKSFDYAQASSAETRTRSSILNLFLNHRDDAESHQYTGGPVSDLFTPIFDSFDEGRKMVGLLTSNVYWQVYFEHVLPNNVNGMFAVLENSCNQTFTYELNGAEVQYLGEGDLHDTKYDHLEVSTGFGGVFLQEGTDDHPGQCIVNIRMFPSQTMENDYLTATPVIFTVVLVSTFIFTSLVFIWYQRLVDRRQMVVMKAAVQSTTVVQSLFPANVRDRLFEENETRQGIISSNKCTNPQSCLPRKSSIGFRWNNTDEYSPEASNKSVTGELGRQTVLTSESIFGSKPIADLFTNTTIMFADMVGFTAWASVREPTDVFIMLETIYHSFDVAAKRMRVFKVETVGDCYVAVAGLPTPRDDHAIVMAKFALQCLTKMRQISRELETSLGPGTADLGLRIGLHSGPVTAGVLRGDKGRFQLFGDTMNTASRMESTGIRGKVHLSRDTADLIRDAGKSNWVVPREGRVIAKGKGELQTYWLSVSREINPLGDSFTSSNDDPPSISPTLTEDTTVDDSSVGDRSPIPPEEGEESTKASRLIQWNVDVLSRLLKKIIARRVSKSRSSTKANRCLRTNSSGSLRLIFAQKETVLDEVMDIIALPKFDAQKCKKQMDPKSIELEPKVIEQITAFVTEIASLYNKNPFHNFEHASHVMVSVTKLLSRIVNPVEVSTTGGSRKAVMANLHHYTFGITSDPLTQFACVFSALIHDLDHPGVSNDTLVQEKSPLAAKYKNKSVAEQNSVDLAWDLFMAKEYEDFRSCIYSDIEELKRFRQLVVNVVMATDIMDKGLGALRKARWEKAFSEEGAVASDNDDSNQEDANRKATIVIEHLIQASDVAHTMQHWHVYQKWNERLFQEMYIAYKTGRTEKDPSEFWYKSEIGFFDFYIIPLAKKLETCGVFGVSSDEYLNYAMANRREWEEKGEQIVIKYVERSRNGEILYK